MAPERLCLLRQAHGLSKQDLAAAIGISASYLSLLESGNRHGSPAVLAKLAAYFRIDVALLFVPPPDTPASPCRSRAS
jgi:transcriptional regulator with XRE-family HTH domain